MGTDASMGLFGNIAIGILGAFVGGFIFSVLGGSDITGFNLYSLLVAVAGSVTLLWFGQFFQRD